MAIDTEYHTSQQSLARDSMDGSSVDVEADLLIRPTPANRVLNQVLGPFQSCLLGSVTNCQQLLLGDEDVQQIAESLLDDIVKSGKKRSLALQELYILTNSEHQMNRYVRRT